MKEEFFSIQPPFGERWVYYKSRWASEDFFETLSIVAGLQGDRLNGLVIASRLCRFLQDIEDGKETGYQLGGNIQIFPLVNQRAVESGTALWSFDNLNADLAFPGVEEGDLTEKVCHALIRQTQGSEIGLILQTAGPHFEDTPHVQLHDPTRHLRHLTRCLGFNVAREIPDHPTLGLQLIKQWDHMGIAPLLISAGRPQVVDTHHCDNVFEGIVNFMLMTGFLKHNSEKGRKSDTVFYSTQGERAVNANEAGLFMPQVTAGDSLQAGQPIGEIRDLYSGKTLETVTASHDGLLISLRTHPLVHEKEPVATLLTETHRRWFWPFS